MRSLRALLGLLLAGYGVLVLARVLAHDSLVVGGLCLVLGCALLTGSIPPLGLRRGRLVAALGAVLVLGVLGYNLARHSSLGVPELAIVAYGAALVVAAPFLPQRVGRTDIGTLVGWSFPLLLAPLTLFAANASISSPQAGAAASPWVALMVVTPTAWGLRLMGTPVEVVGRNMIVATERGSLTLDVGLVCAGLYPIILFAGIVALHAWREGFTRRQAIGLVGAGLLGLWMLNLLRLVVLTKIGIAYGPQALASAHANLGWLFFAVFMVAFWAVVLRTKEAAPIVRPTEGAHDTY